jgi:putative phage-type endonuclease
MQIHDLIQGSPEWHAYRAAHFNASDAPAMMNCSPYKTRTELLNERKTGLTPEIDAHTQRIFNDGHRYEGIARPLAEKIIGEELYPVTGSMGPLSASFDGLTMDEAIAWEHKSLNDKLRAVNSAEELPLHYRVQMEQQLLVSGAEKCLFMATKWDNDELVDEKHFEYYSEAKLRDDIINGWMQFKSDLESHEVKAVIELPKAEAIMELPAVIVQVKGELTLCNMADVRPQFDDFLANAITIMVSDEDFARAEAESKMGRDVAKRCLATAKGVVDQTSTISEVTRELELYAAKFNALALSQEKAVKSQKEARKVAIMSEAVKAYSVYKDALEAEISPIKLHATAPDFAGAMKAKRTISSLEDAVASELALAKINADSVAKEIRSSLAYLKETAKDYRFLFNDLQAIIYLDGAQFQMVVQARIESHKKAEADKLEAQRLQIEAEAKRKAEAEQAEKLEAERAIVRAEEQAKITEQQRLDKLELEVTRAKQAVEQAVIDAAIESERIKVEALAQAKALHETATRIAEQANYADRNADKQAELDGAARLHQKANAIELSYKDEVKEIKPVNSGLINRAMIVFAIAEKYSLSDDQALQVILNAFGIEIEELAA